jgi:hypothetical protein
MKGSMRIRNWQSWLWRRLVPAVLVLALAVATGLGAARAAVVDGVQLPNSVQADGTTLRLNGAGLRTYSLFRIHIYVAALYLQHRSSDPQAIIHSPETKLLVIRFEHDVDAQRARAAWREGLLDNCQAPCRLDPADLERFLASVPAMRAGDTFSFLFTRNGARVVQDNQLIGVIRKPCFAEAMLASFLGPRPGSERVKQGLLGGPA